MAADVACLYPNIPHEASWEKEREKISTEDLVKTTEFVLKNNYFEFDLSVYQQVSGTTIDTKFSPAHACIFMDRLENNFLEMLTLNH